MGSILKMQANWDDEAQVWVVDRTPIPGLVAEASTIPQLIAKLKILIPEMLEENGGFSTSQSEIPFEVVAGVTTFASNTAQ